jgi:ABC-type multidrug transport system ATPase subunit
VTEKTEGNLVINGQIAPLIELGAGFHPELTGGENIYFNAMILGLTRRDIRRRFDGIVQFAGLERFIDTPFKRYSAGMKVRLGFAIAAHTDPEILLVDEVLSVGDMSFQRRCIKKITELREMKKTIVFISHNLNSVDGICDRAIFLNNGKLLASGRATRIIQTYQNFVNEEMKKGIKREYGLPTDFSSNEVMVTAVKFFDGDGREKTAFHSGESMTVRVSYFAPQRINKPIFSFGIYLFDGRACCVERTKYHGLEIDHIEGHGSFEVEIEKVQLIAGVYTFGVIIYDSQLSLPYVNRRQDKFRVESYMPETGDNCVFHPSVKWRI